MLVLELGQVVDIAIDDDVQVAGLVVRGNVAGCEGLGHGCGGEMCGSDGGEGEEGWKKSRAGEYVKEGDRGGSVWLALNSVGNPAAIYQSHASQPASQLQSAEGPARIAGQNSISPTEGQSRQWTLQRGGRVQPSPITTVPTASTAAQPSTSVQVPLDQAQARRTAVSCGTFVHASPRLTRAKRPCSHVIFFPARKTQTNPC